MNELKIKLLTPTARTVARAHAYDAGLDLFSDERRLLVGGDLPSLVSTGIAIELPPGYQATVLPRSSLSSEGILVHVGTIDAGYTGLIKVCMQVICEVNEWLVQPGQKIAQLVITRVELPTVRVVDELELCGRARSLLGKRVE